MAASPMNIMVMPTKAFQAGDSPRMVGILNALALNPLRRVFVFIFNAFEVLDGAGIESKILK